MSNKENFTKDEFHKLNEKEKILWFSAAYQAPEGLSKEEVFKKLTQKIEAGVQAKPIEKVVLPQRIIWSAAALAIVLLGLVFIWNTNSMETIVAEKGKQLKYDLPDGSKVILNAESSISFSLGPRSVELRLLPSTMNRNTAVK